MENQDKIFDVLKETGIMLKAGEIAEKTGIDAKIVTKELSKMKKDGKVVSPKVCYYTPA